MSDISIYEDGTVAVNIMDKVVCSILEHTMIHVSLHRYIKDDEEY